MPLVDERETAPQSQRSLGPLAAVSDTELLQRFESQRIAHEEWTHVEHLRIAFVYLRNRDWADVVDRMRRGIILLNVSQNVPNSSTSGYHETMTIAWLRLIAAALERPYADNDSLAFLTRNPRLVDTAALSAHYSAELLRDSRSRREFILPDHRPLP